MPSPNKQFLKLLLDQHDFMVPMFASKVVENNSIITPDKTVSQKRKTNSLFMKPLVNLASKVKSSSPVAESEPIIMAPNEVQATANLFFKESLVKIDETAPITSHMMTTESALLAATKINTLVEGSERDELPIAQSLDAGSDMPDVELLGIDTVGTESILNIGLPQREATTTDDQLEAAFETPEPLTEVEQMVVITKSFFEQVAPFVAEQIAEFMTEQPLEACAEIMSQIQQLVVVADRLHELVFDGLETGDEALLIEAFLSREYEQLLGAVLPEATPEIITKMIIQFMRYIHSDSYNFAAALQVTEVKYNEEGTHEMKPLDEAGVFTKAQQTTIIWRRKLHWKIGNLMLKNQAA